MLALPSSAAERLSVLETADDGAERPRERLWLRGTDAVDDIDLVALVLGTGTRNRSATVLAADLLQHTAGLAGLLNANPHELTRLEGIGIAQAARILAAVAMGVRAVDHCRTRSGAIGCAADVHRRMWPRVAGLEQEVFFVLAIDVRDRIIADLEVSRGHLTGVDVHPREVFRPLIRAGAVAGVVVHNHPSGDPTPSTTDLLLTKRLREVGELIGIPIIDHVVIAECGFTSIAAWFEGQARKHGRIVAPA